MYGLVLNHVCALICKSHWGHKCPWETKALIMCTEGGWNDAYISTLVRGKMALCYIISYIQLEYKLEHIFIHSGLIKLVVYDVALEEFLTESLRWHSPLLSCSTSALCGLVSVVCVALGWFVSLLSPVLYPWYDWRIDNVFLSQLLSAAARPQRSPRKSTKVEKLRNIPRSPQPCRGSSWWNGVVSACKCFNHGSG